MSDISVFISYAHYDRILAEEIASGLAAHDIRVWIDEGELRASDSLITRISDVIDEVDFVVADIR